MSPPPTELRPSPKAWLRVVLGDVQFWVPVVVLIGGLLVLNWIH